MATAIWLPILEDAVNRWLALDPGSAACLSRLEGRVLRIEVAGLAEPIFLGVLGGSLQLGADPPTDPHVTLRGPPFSLLRLLRSSGGAPLLDGDVQVEGDIGVLQDLHACLAALEVDWEELLARRIGDVAAHGLVRQVRAVAGWVGEGRESLRLDLREYLWEEARLLPRREAVEEQLSAVDALRDDVERLAKRIERLEARLANRSGP
ncbi:MAG: SCP2 sterol-binding domain-containing protein [Gammaproteobacteria bacterium]|jgi:ubiquinone biosynthesis protein UbiJ|nr:SCP2 sterol-binding domain-containing protein [Gammaproteobacteria bacterium]